MKYKVRNDLIHLINYGFVITGMILISQFQSNAQVSSSIPRRVKNGNAVQLLIENKPYLINT